MTCYTSRYLICKQGRDARHASLDLWGYQHIEQRERGHEQKLQHLYTSDWRTW